MTLPASGPMLDALDSRYLKISQEGSQTTLGTVTVGVWNATPIVDTYLAGLSSSKLTGALPAISGAALTAIPAGALTGTLPNATFPATLPAASATNLTSIPATQLTGTVPTANVVGAYANVTTVGSNAGLVVAAGTAVKGITKYAQALSPVAVAANTAAEQSLTVTGITATDVVIAFVKPTTQAGLAIGNVRVTGANTIAVNFINDTAAIITPTAAETYTVVALTF